MRANLSFYFAYGIQEESIEVQEEILDMEHSLQPY